MKKSIRAFVKNTAKRFIAASLALCALSGVLSYQDAFAEPDDGTTQQTTVSTEASAEASTEASAGDDETSGDGTTTTSSDELVADKPQGITVWKDGQMLQVTAKTGSEWEMSDVSGSDDPTLPAKSVEEWTNGQGSITVDSKVNLYTLTAATGIKAGTSVEYFAVRYKVGTGDNAVAQTKYIFPKVHTLSATNDYIKSLKGTKTERAWVRTSFTGKKSTRSGRSTFYEDYTQVYNTTTEAEYNAARLDFRTKVNSITNEERIYGNKTIEYDLSVANQNITNRHDYLKSLNLKINENTLTENALSPWGIDEFLFMTDEPITEVTGIEAFMSSGSWTVQGLSVSKVNKIGGYQEYGYYSGKYYLALEKELICQLSKKKSGTLTLSAAGDTLINVGGEDSIYFALTTPDQKTTSSLGYSDLYTFRLDFADTVTGGIETFLRNDSARSSPDIGNIAEDLAVELEYKDINGYVRNVTMPVILSVLGQYHESGDTVRTIGLAQRGDTLAFTCCLPDYASVVKTKLYVGSAARDILKTNCGLDYIVESTIDSTLLAELDSDNIALAGMSLYKGTCRMSNTADGTENVTVVDDNGKESTKKVTYDSYSVAFAFSENEPMLYFTTTRSDGHKISAKTSDTIKLVKYNAGSDDPLIATGLAGNFLIGLKTSDVLGADTAGDISVQVYYQDTNGNERSSSIYDVKNEVEKFLGYWPSKNNKKGNFAYTYGVSRRGYVEFPVDLPDAAAITNIQISLDSFADEWQVESISAAVIDGIGKRRVYAQERHTATDSTPYRFVRPMVKTVIPPFPIDLNLLFTPGDTYSVSTGAGTTITSEKLDYSTMRYSMTYEQTKYDLGFIEQEMIYDIDVKVADDPETSNDNGDSGSSNQFYFQLRFRNGNSAFVLANQQLSADGFRAGQDEMFTISTNRNYGELKSIRIIPEDTSEDNDVFDKLNIEYITVTEQSSGGTAIQYVIENVGWIDIDYYDKSENNTADGRSGRSINVLSRPFAVSYKQNVLNLLCEITSDPWEQEYFPFEASVSCTIDYIDTNNQPRSISFDVARRMYEYMKKTPVAYSAGYNNDANAGLYKNMGTVSDSDWMLRPNTKDRFILPAIADVKTLVSMTFTGTNRSKGTAYWYISGLSISRIDSDSGVVTLDKNGEYVRSMKTIAHCNMQKSTEPKVLVLPTGSANKVKINLDQKEIAWSADKSWISAVERTPDTTDDHLNIFIYPTDKSRYIEGVNLNVAIQYKMPDSKEMQIKQNSLNIYGSGTEDAMFYYTGLSAPNMQNLSTIWLTCRSTSTVFSHAIVEQVREDVVVGRYVFNFGKTGATLGLRATPSSTTTTYDCKKQVLTLSFGEKTDEANIIPPNEDNSNANDIAVALVYKSTLDRGESTYSTPYVYLGDVGVKKLSPGMMVDVPFHIPYVDEIVGYKIGAFGGLSAYVNGAVAYNYSYTERRYDEASGQFFTTGDKLKNIYCFDQSFDVPRSIAEKKVTSLTGMAKEGSITPLELDFTTAQASADTESGINTAVEATIMYKDIRGAQKGYYINDLRVYIQPEEDNADADAESKKLTDNDYKQFSTGSTRKVKLFIPECVEITGIELKPQGQDWKLESINGLMQYAWKVEKDADGNTVYTSQKISRVINDYFPSAGKSVSLRDVNLITYLYTGDTYIGIVTEHERSIVCDGETRVWGQVTSESGFDLKVQMIGDVPSDMSVDSYSRSEGGFSFTLPKNNGSVPVAYRISVISRENPNVVDVINVTVPVPEKKETVQNNNSSGSSQDNGNNSGGSSSEQSSEGSGSQEQQETTEPTTESDPDFGTW